MRLFLTQIKSAFPHSKTFRIRCVVVLNASFRLPSTRIKLAEFRIDLLRQTLCQFLEYQHCELANKEFSRVPNWMPRLYLANKANKLCRWMATLQILISTTRPCGWVTLPGDGKGAAIWTTTLYTRIREHSPPNFSAATMMATARSDDIKAMNLVSYSTIFSGKERTPRNSRHIT